MAAHASKAYILPHVLTPNQCTRHLEDATKSVPQQNCLGSPQAALLPNMQWTPFSSLPMCLCM